MSRIGVVSTQVSDGPNKLFCGGLPYELGEEQIKELLSAFGRLRSFHLVRDAGATLSKGYCFFEYMEDAVVEPAISGLNGIPIGDKTLTVRRAQVVASTYAAPTYAASQAPAVAVPFQHIPVTTNPFEVPAVLNQSSRVLCLLSMVEADELRDDQDYADIKEDILEECGKFGMVSQVVIPRPDPRGLPVPGLGKVFVEFANAEQCGSAKASLEGRKFANRTVIATFYPEEHFASRALY
jgi:splicing factor U2AF subunit